MTEDDVTRGSTQTNILSRAPFDAVAQPSCIESVVASLPTGEGGIDELWKLNHYYERLDEWNAEHGVAPNPFAGGCRRAGVRAAQPHRGSRGAPQPRRCAAAAELSQMTSILDAQRDQKRLVPSLRNP